MPTILEAWLCVDSHFPSCIDYSVFCWMVCFFYVRSFVSHFVEYDTHDLFWTSEIVSLALLCRNVFWNPEASENMASRLPFMPLSVSWILSISLNYEFVIRWQLSVWSRRIFLVDSGRMISESSWHILDSICCFNQQIFRVSVWDLEFSHTC